MLLEYQTLKRKSRISSLCCCG